MEKLEVLRDYGFIKSKKALHAYNRYVPFKNGCLFDVYGSFSQAKQRAYDYCIKLANDLGGRGFSIMGANCMQFTVGFTFSIDNKKYFAYITKDYNRYYEI